MFHEITTLAVKAGTAVLLAGITGASVLAGDVLTIDAGTRVPIGFVMAAVVPVLSFAWYVSARLQAVDDLKASVTRVERAIEEFRASHSNTEKK